MVAFVLDHPGVESGDLAADRTAERIESLVAQMRVAGHHAAEPRDRQAPLPVFVDRLGERRQHGIDELGVRDRLGVGVTFAVLDTENHDL